MHSHQGVLVLDAEGCARLRPQEPGRAQLGNLEKEGRACSENEVLPANSLRRRDSLRHSAGDQVHPRGNRKACFLSGRGPGVVEGVTAHRIRRGCPGLRLLPARGASPDERELTRGGGQLRVEPRQMVLPVKGLDGKAGLRRPCQPLEALTLEVPCDCSFPGCRRNSREHGADPERGRAACVLIHAFPPARLRRGTRRRRHRSSSGARRRRWSPGIPDAVRHRSS